MEDTKKAQTQNRFDWDGDILTVTTPDGSVGIYDTSEVSPEVEADIRRNGYKQKVNDYQTSLKLKNQEKLDLIQECHDLLVAGNWSQERAPREVISKKKLEEAAKANLSPEEQEQLEALREKMGL